MDAQNWTSFSLVQTPFISMQITLKPGLSDINPVSYRIRLVKLGSIYLINYFLICILLDNFDDNNKCDGLISWRNLVLKFAK